MRTTALALCAACATAATAPVAPQTAPLPPPDAGSAAAAAPVDAGPPPPRALGDDEAKIALGELCLSCHTIELIETSRIGEAAWNAEMTKMKKWGALIDDQMAGPLAAWLAQRYPPAETPPAPAAISPADAAAEVAPQPEKGKPGGNPSAGGPLYAQSCASCHGKGALGLGGGPVLVEAPMLWQRERFAAVIRKGRGRMPAFDTLSGGQIADLLAFLRAAGAP